MKVFSLFLISGILIAVPAFGDPNTEVEFKIPPMETSRILYSSEVSNRFSYFTDVLERGFPVGQIKVKEGAPASGSVDSLEAMTKAFEQWKVEWHKAYAENQRKILENLKESAFTPTTRPTKSSGVLPAVIEGRVPSEVSLEKFFVCAERSLPLLKKRIQCQQRKNTRCEVALDKIFLGERGNGKVSSPAGLICGKYLGKYGSPSPSLINDIKTLSVLHLAKKDALSNDLWMAFLLYSRSLRGEVLLVPGFWEYAWKRLSFQEVFIRLKKVSLKQVQDAFLSQQKTEFEATTKESKGAHLIYPEEEMRKRVEKDLVSIKALAQEMR